MKRIYFALEGTKSSNFLNKVGDFISSDFGKTIISGISQLAVPKTANKVNLDKKYNPENLIDNSVIWLQVDLQIAQLQNNNPDVHYSNIDRDRIYNLLYKEYLAKAKKITDLLKAEEMSNFDNLISNNDGFSKVLESGLGIFGLLFSSKGNSTTPTSTTTSTTQTPTINNGSHLDGVSWEQFKNWV